MPSKKGGGKTSKAPLKFGAKVRKKPAFFFFFFSFFKFKSVPFRRVETRRLMLQER